MSETHLTTARDESTSDASHSQTARTTASAPARRIVRALTLACSLLLVGTIAPAIIAVVLLFRDNSTGQSASGMLIAILILASLQAACLAGLIFVLLSTSIRTLLETYFERLQQRDRVHDQALQTFERIAHALENGASLSQPRPKPDTNVLDLAEFRQAIRKHDWEAAESALLAFADSQPDDLVLARARSELDQAKQAATGEFFAKIEAARQAGDPERVLELHATIKPLVENDARQALDRDLAKWFIMLIQRRLRTGTARVDVAVLAARVAESFDETTEGASLRASLPTLRRAAGLCGRCAQPYTGTADACPACTTAVAVQSVAFSIVAEDDEPEPVAADPFETFQSPGVE